MPLTKESFLAVEDTLHKKFTLKTYGNTDIWVRRLKVKERVIFDKEKDANKVGNQMIAKCVCDENGTPLFNEEDCDQLESLGISTVNELLECVNEVNEFTEIKVNQAVKNS